MRKGLRHLVVALIAVLLATGTFLLVQTLRLYRRADLREQVLEVLPEVAQRIRDFYRARVVDGRKVWEVSAREAQYLDKERTAVIIGPSVSFFLEDGGEIALRGEEGRIYLGDKEMEGLELRGAIEVKFGAYALHADAARYERDRNVIVAPGEVRISGDEFDIRGDRMTIQLSVQNVLVEGNVRTVLRPGA